MSKNPLKQIPTTDINDTIKVHSKSFTFATAFLPYKDKTAIRTLYAFCRTCDNLVDDNPNASIELIEGFQKDFNSQEPQIDVNKQFKKVVEEFNIPMQYPNELIEGCKRDLSQNRYETFSDLCSYCYQVASTVGIMSSYILGFNSQKTELVLEHAIKAGIALQLTNIIRDVGEDIERGRVYIPKEDFELCNCDYKNPESWKDSYEFKQLINLQINKARNLYKEGKKGLKLLNLPGRFSVAIALRVYEGILDEVIKNKYDVLRQRAYLSFYGKLNKALYAFFECF